MTKLSDCWETPQDLFDVLDKGGTYQGLEFIGYKFDVDLCADVLNSKCLMYCTDFLNTEPLQGLNCFMNPPYSNPLPFIEKAWEMSKHCKIVCLLKVDTSTKWWSTFWHYNAECTFCSEHSFMKHDGVNEEFIYCPYCSDTKTYRGPKPGCEVIFFPKRVKFQPPNNGEYCVCEKGRGLYYATGPMGRCKYCRSCGKIRPTAPSFASCLVIMDRRGEGCEP